MKKLSGLWGTPSRAIMLATLYVSAGSLAAASQTFNVVYAFHGVDGNNPTNEALVQGSDGNLYGTAASGGQFSDGTAFGITPQGSIRAYNFDGTYGSSPLSGLVLGFDNLLHGTTSLGGTSNNGVIFTIGPRTPIALKWDFDGSDGSQPQAALTLGVDGQYYGGTVKGGDYGFGTIFKVTSAGQQTVLHNFDTQVFSSEFPGTEGSLIYGPDGALYGVTYQGGSFDRGTIFRITFDGEFRTIYNFGADGSNLAHPVTTLLLASDGNLYGSTSDGGDFGLGTLFRLDSSGAVTVLHSFDGADGSGPSGALIQATDGKLYGTANATGQYGAGDLFSVTTDGAFSVLHSFNVMDGQFPWGVMQHTNGKFYGVTNRGGGSTECFNGCGEVFSLDVGLTPFVAFVSSVGRIGQTGGLLGQGFVGATSVSIAGVPASFTVVSDTFIKATIPMGATTGFVTVTTTSGTFTSNVPFRVIP